MRPIKLNVVLIIGLLESGYIEFDRYKSVIEYLNIN